MRNCCRACTLPGGRGATTCRKARIMLTVAMLAPPGPPFAPCPGRSPKMACQRRACRATSVSTCSPIRTPGTKSSKRIREPPVPEDGSAGARRSGLAPEASGDDVALDVARAFADHIDEGIAVDAAYRVLTHDAGAAVDADRLFADRQGRLAGNELD